MAVYNVKVTYLTDGIRVDWENSMCKRFMKIFPTEDAMNAYIKWAGWIIK